MMVVQTKSVNQDIQNTSESRTQKVIPLVSIIIVTWNAADDIEECLDSILAQTHDKFQIIVVDSASSDTTLEILADKYPMVEVIASDENLGYRRANRVGMTAAKGDYVLVCNDDIRVEPDWLSKMVETMEGDSSIGITTPMIDDYFKPPLISAAGNTLHYSGTSGHIQARGIPKDEYRNGSEIAAVSGCCFMLKRELMEQLGGFSTDFDEYASGFHASLEEVDLGWRAQLMGYRIVLVEDAILYHKHNWNKLHAKRFASRECGRYLTVLRNYEVRTIVLLIPVFLFLEVMTLTLAASKGLEWVQRKLHVWGWIVANFGKIRLMRTRVQALRNVPDIVIVRRMSPTISFSYTIGYGRLGGLINLITNGIFTLYYRLLCAILSR